MEGAIHILIMDDRTLVRELLAHRLNNEPGLQAEASSSSDTGLELARCRKPSAVVLHTVASGPSPFSTAQALSTISPESKIVFIGQGVRDIEIEQALRVGAHGYLTEQQTFAEIVAAIRTVVAGESWFAPEVRARISHAPERSGSLNSHHTALSTISDREREVLIHTARGMSTKEVARLMHVSNRTVESHVARMLKKLALRDRVALTRYAIREGLVTA